MVGIAGPGLCHHVARSRSALIICRLLFCERAGTLYHFARDTRRLTLGEKTKRYRLNRGLQRLNEREAVCRYRHGLTLH